MNKESLQIITKLFWIYQLIQSISFVFLFDIIKSNECVINRVQGNFSTGWY